MADQKNTPKEKEEVVIPKTEEGTIIKFSEKTWVEGTGKGKHMPKGQKYHVQKVHGQRLIEMGVAEKCDAPEPKKK